MTRPLTVDDTAAVDLALDGAFNWDPSRERLPLEHAAVQPYRAGWGRPGDLGVVAEAGGAPVGAAYCHNPARRLYERAGYRGVGVDEGGSVVMLLEL